jgi:hypothetical protein
MNDKPYLVANQMSGGPGQYITDLVADKSNRIEHNGGETKVFTTLYFAGSLSQ